MKSLAHAPLGEESASEAAMDFLPLFERRSCARGVRSASGSLASLRPAERPRYGASRPGRLRRWRRRGNGAKRRSRARQRSKNARIWSPRCSTTSRR